MREGCGHSVYHHLTDRGRGDPFDRHLFACILIAGLDDGRPLAQALGLAPAMLRAVCGSYFPDLTDAWLAEERVGEPGADAPEEPDLRQLLVDHGSCGRVEEEWLAAIIARRSLKPNHLWQDLGLFDRTDLSRLLHRHFGPLAVRNVDDMKWKKFFYRELCRNEGMLLCKAPACDICSDFNHCFGGEPGEPLTALQRAKTHD